MKKYRSQKGFTLIELLAALLVLVVVGSIIAQILVTAFRTSKKSDSIALIKQSGNFALTEMAKTIRNARELMTPYPCGTPSSPTTSNSLQIISPDGRQITLSCDLTNNLLASDSVSLIDNQTLQLSAPCNFVCSQVSSTDLPLITISFGLQQKVTSSFVENVAAPSPILFTTSVTLRNLTR